MSSDPSNSEKLLRLKSFRVYLDGEIAKLEPAPMRESSQRRCVECGHETWNPVTALCEFEPADSDDFCGCKCVFEATDGEMGCKHCNCMCDECRNCSGEVEHHVARR